MQESKQEIVQQVKTQQETNISKTESKEVSVQSRKKIYTKGEHQGSKLAGKCASNKDTSKKESVHARNQTIKTQANGKESKEPESNEQESKIMMCTDCIQAMR